jgi:hypothetical protein
MPGAEGDLELLAKEQVLDGQGLTAADGGDEGGQDKPVEFEHLGKSPITTRDRLAGRTFAPLQVGVPSAFVNSLHKLAMCFAIIHELCSHRLSDSRFVSHVRLARHCRPDLSRPVLLPGSATLLAVAHRRVGVFRGLEYMEVDPVLDSPGPPATTALMTGLAG